MALEALICKECGTRYPAGGSLSSASAASARSRSPTTSPSWSPSEARRKIQAGSRGIWRYADFLPFSERPRDPLEPGLTPLVRADRLAERLGLGELWIKNDAANPTHSFKDRVVAVALAKARELGFETVACASTGNLANAVAAHAAASGLDAYVFVPADLEEQKLLATGVYGTSLVGVRGTYDDVNRLCTQLCETRPWAFVNVNLRPVLLRGLEDPRVRDRRAARLVATRSGRLPDRFRLAVHEDRQGVRPVAGARVGRRRAAGVQRRPGERAAGRLPRRSPRAGMPASRSGPRRSPRALRSATRPTASTRSTWRGEPAARSTRSSDDEIRDGIRLLAETTGIFTETAGGVTVAVLAKLAERGDIDPSERVVVYITGEGLKTLDATRERLPDARDRADTGGLRVRTRAGRRALRFPADDDHREDPGAASRRDRGRGRDRGGRGRPSAKRSTPSSTSTTSFASGSPRTEGCAGS